MDGKGGDERQRQLQGEQYEAVQREINLVRGDRDDTWRAVGGVSKGPEVTEDICAPLEAEDFVPQPTADVSPPKWHLGQVTWFFERVFLEEHVTGYKPFNPD